MENKINLYGYTDIELRKECGDILRYRYSNTVLIPGKRLAAELLAQNTNRPNHITHFALGSGVNAVNVNDVSLQTEIGRAAIGETTIVTQSDNSVVLQMPATFPVGEGTGNITEFGVINAAAGSPGVLYNRTLLALPLVKGANDSVTFTYNLVFI